MYRGIVGNGIGNPDDASFQAYLVVVGAFHDSNGGRWLRTTTHHLRKQELEADANRNAVWGRICGNDLEVSGVDFPARANLCDGVFD